MYILAIDDEQLSQQFIQSVLTNEHEIIVSGNGETGIQLAKEKIPDLIILDVRMPGLDGYEVCSRLKNMPETTHIPVLFLSANTDLDEQLKGYSAGGTDYIAKPCVPEALRAKVNAIGSYIVHEQHLQASCQEASKTAHLALLGNSELGLAMRFMENSYSYSSLNDLANEFFKFSNELQLVCAMSFYINDEAINYFSDNNSSPLEIELLDKMRTQRRIFDYGRRTFINYPNVTLLVKNMPVDDGDRSGRIKDLLPMALAALSNKLYTIATETSVRDQIDELTTSFDQIKQSLLSLGNSLRMNHDKCAYVLHTMVDEINDFLPKLALEDDQESYILDYIEKSTTKSLNLNDSADQMNSTFHEIICKLELSLNKQHLMLKEIDSQASNVPLSDDQVANDAVELFV